MGSSPAYINTDKLGIKLVRLNVSKAESPTVFEYRFSSLEYIGEYNTGSKLIPLYKEIIST